MSGRVYRAADQPKQIELFPRGAHVGLFITKRNKVLAGVVFLDGQVHSFFVASTSKCVLFVCLRDTNQRPSLSVTAASPLAFSSSRFWLRYYGNSAIFAAFPFWIKSANSEPLQIRCFVVRPSCELDDLYALEDEVI